MTSFTLVNENISPLIQKSLCIHVVLVDILKRMPAAYYKIISTPKDQ